ncbi:RHS repeat-associated protein, partial [Ruminiclostridium sufflavum DSM 19573]
MSNSRINIKLIIPAVISAAIILTAAIPADKVFAEGGETGQVTVQEIMNNLTGPKQQYNAMLSPAYLRNNVSEEAISEQSGELLLAQTDYVLPGVNGLDLEIKRIYKSGTANVRDMKADYINGIWVDTVYTDDTTGSFYEDRYDLGAGMRFSFPSIEIKKNQDGSSYKFLHTDTGDVYTLINPAVTGGAYTIENQTIEDVEIKENSDFVNGAGETSFYAMTNKSGKKTYFAQDGRILGISDRYGNKITFRYNTSTYTIDGRTKTKTRISKIIDTAGREVGIEYKEDQSFTVGAVQSSTYSLEDSYKASQNPDTINSGDLKGKFQVIITLPGGEKIIYDKSAVLVSDSKHVIRTRLQRVYDVDGKPKYHFWYDQPELGFTFKNGTSYSAYNRYENLTQIDYCRTNRLERFTYNTYAKSLTESGSMQYRKIFEKKELAKTGYDTSKANFLDRFQYNAMDRTAYKYTNEADGFGNSAYAEAMKNYSKIQADNDKKAAIDAYLKDTYKYITEKTDNKGTTAKYTYNGIHELLNTVETGSDHKRTTVTEYDEKKFPLKTEETMVKMENGQETGQAVRKIQNYAYDIHGNLTSYTGPEAARDENGEPVSDKYKVTYGYDYGKFDVMNLKTWNQDESTNCQTIFTIDDMGNVTQEKKVHNGNESQYLVTDYEYDTHGNMTKKTVHSGEKDYTTNYSYGTDADGADQKGACLTGQWSTSDNGNIKKSKKYAYDFDTGNMTAELEETAKSDSNDSEGNKIYETVRSVRTGYTYDLLSRISKITYPDSTIKQYEYSDTYDGSYRIKNKQIDYTDPEGTKFRYEYDIFGNQTRYSVYDKAENNGYAWQLLKADEYDSKGNKTKETDSNGHSTRFAYNSDNMLVNKEYYEKDTNKKENITLDYIYKSDGDNGSGLLITLTDEDGYKSRLHYDILNRLVKSEQTPDNKTYYSTAYKYDYTGNTTEKTDSKGTTKFEYDDLGRLVTKKDALSNETKYTYNSLGSILTAEEPDGRTTEYIYDFAGRVLEERTYDKAEQGSCVYKKYGYDGYNSECGRIETVALGRVEDNNGDAVNTVSSYTEYYYNSMDRIADEYGKIDENRKAHTHYEYDGKGNIIASEQYTDEAESSSIKYLYSYDYGDRVTKEEGIMTVSEPANQAAAEYGHYINTAKYDYAGNLIAQEQYNGTGYEKTTYSYDYRNRLTEKTEPFAASGKTTRLKYDKRGNIVTKATTCRGAECTVQYRYNGMGKITAQIDSEGYVTKYLHDEEGNLIKEADPRYSSQDISESPGMEYSYDALNRLVTTTVINEDKTRTVISFKAYDGRGNIIKEADGEGYSSQSPSRSIGKEYKYDASNNIKSYTSAQAAKENAQNGTNIRTKAYTYDGSGRILTEKDAAGNETKNTYYLNGLLKETVYADNTRESYDYDLTGKARTIKTDKAQNIITVYSNIFGKTYKTEYPDNTSEAFEYSPKGELVKSTDRAGNKKYYEYDPSGNIISQKEYIKTDGGFDNYRLVKSTYDEKGSILSTETFKYKVNTGSLTGGAEETAGDAVHYTYDKNGRAISVTGPGKHETINEYDKKGNLITKKQKLSENDYRVERYSYDVQSRPVEQALLADTSDIEGSYLKNVEFDREYTKKIKIKTKYTYYSDGQLKTKTEANGSNTEFKYDLDKNLIKKTEAKDKLDIETAYEYDLNGNLRKETNAKNTAVAYEYDSMNRLIRKKAPASDGEQAITRYIYDLSGNLKKQIQPNDYEPAKDTREMAEAMAGISYTYDSMNRRLMTIMPDGKAAECLEYDANGNISKRADGIRYADAQEDDGTEGDTYSGNMQQALGTIYQYDGLNRAVKTTDAAGNSKGYEYDVLGNLTKITDEKNNTSQYEYNVDGTLRKLTFADTGAAEYTYDGLGRKTSQKDQLGNITEYSYNSFGSIKEERDPYGNTIENKTDLLGNITSAKDKNGSLTKITYDAANRITEKKLPLEKDSSGNTVYSIEKYTYDAIGKITAIETTGTKDKLSSRITSYTYNDSGLVNAVTDSSGAYERSYYDKNGNTVKTEKLRSADIYDIEKFEYDSMNRLVKDIKLIAEADIYKEALDPAELTMLEGLRDSEYTDRYRMVTAYEYDALGNKIKETAPAAYLYGEGTEGRDKNTTVYTYDVLNRLEKITRKYDDGEGNIKDVYTQYTYDATGNKETETNERGFVTRYAYDELGRVETITDEENNTIAYTYDTAGNKTAETNAKGTMTYSYDRLNRQKTVTDAYNRVISCNVYDANGNIIKTIDASGYLSGNDEASRYGTVYSYNLANMVTEKSTPEAVKENTYTEKYEYNQYGEVIRQTNSLGEATAYEYDEAGRLTKVTDPLKVTTKYSYDKLGSKLSMTDGRGKLTRYSYTAFGMLKAVTNPDGKTESYKYALSGKLACVTDKKGNKTLYTYDSTGQLLEKRAAATGDSIKYTYDESGNRSTMEDESGKSTYEYDRSNRLKTIKKAGLVQISYDYDAVGNVTKVTDLKGNETGYTYDASSRMETVAYGGKTTEYEYDENGRRKAITYDGGVKEEYGYDRDNRLISMTNKKPNGSSISEYAYEYDTAGRQISKTDSYGTTGYEYDKAGRITKITAPGKTTVYAYDKAGNRISLNEAYTSPQPCEYIDGTTGQGIQYILKKSDYTYSGSNTLLKLTERMLDESNREIARKTTAYIYDDNGNQLKQSVSHTLPENTAIRPAAKGTAYGNATSGSIDTLLEKTSNTYDGFNRLRKTETVKGGIRTTAEYAYNGDDLRVSKTVKKSDSGYTAEVTNYQYDRQNVILETDANSSIKARYIKGINYIASIAANGDETYFLYNGHGDVGQTVDEAGEVQNQYDYDIWGNPTLTVETASNSIRYAGEFFDNETGLYYLRARYYDPYTGRFTTEDSYWGEDENPLSLNLYTYCFNNPVMYTDPTGHAVAKLGTRGDTVQAIQEKLNKLGYNVGKADGIFGEKTKAAVIKFQKDNGLTVDGIVGNQTLTEIYFEQSKQSAKANGITLPEAQKAKVGQISGNVSIMTDAKFNQAIANIVETKAKTNGGSLNTDVKN